MAGHAGTPSHGSKLTYEDYVTLPNDGRRYEILDGDLAVSPSPRTAHQRVVQELFVVLRAWSKEHRLGETFVAPYDVILDDTTVVVPDLIFVSKSHSAIITARAIEGTPDLIVEVLSESTARHDRGAKRKLYARYGVDHYWLVDPDARSLEVYALRDGAYELAGTYRNDAIVTCDVPAGLKLRLGEVWPKA
jgi:Uma2 family endonuclease